MNFIRIYIISLLSLLPLALQGQANFRTLKDGEKMVLPKRQSDPWQRILLQGGLFRWDDSYIRIDNGAASLITSDYVNGHALGPKLTIGKVLKDYSRIELDANLRWAFSRNVLMAKGALRYLFQPQYFGFLEVFGGKYTNDFDRYPVLDESGRSFASGLFGWNHFKLYEQTTAGARLYGAVGKDIQMTILTAWEKRGQLVNHRKTNIFGQHANDNVPIVQGERMADFGTDKILRLDAQLDWMPGRRIIVIDDLDAIAAPSKARQVSGLPAMYSLRATSGWNSGLRFLSLEASVQGVYAVPAAPGSARGFQLSYQAAAGFFPIRTKVMLMDARHFDASEFGFQRTASFCRFSLLDNYELSTSKSWAEAHAEAFLPDFIPLMSLFLQAHGAKVVACPFHTEISAGFDLQNVWRVGVSVGFDDEKYDGVALNIQLNL